jgi:Amt family ammonium transporter
MIDKGVTTFMILATSLVMLMTPGLSFFYGGLGNKRNILNIMMQSFVSLGITTILWFAFGYSLCFSGSMAEGTDLFGVIGNFDKVFLKGITPSTMMPGKGFPEYVFFAYQMMFAIITPALITGAFINRVTFKSYVFFLIFWQIFVYYPFVHMVWGGGLLAEWGVLDFAGGIVVHATAGFAALIAVIYVGKREDVENHQPNNIPLVAIGTALLWFGWYGFNAGSELAVDGITASAFLVTNTSAAVGALSWMAAEWITTRKPTLLGIASGVVAGLVGITPAAGFVNLPASIIIGLVAGLLGYFSVAKLKGLVGYDDSLDAFGVHGICGIWGALATGIFANPAVNSAGTGLIYGNPKQVGIQALSILGTAAFSAVGTYIVILITGAVTGGLRVLPEQEIEGLDSALHGERGFEITF